MENCCFSRWLWPDWKNTAWAAMAGLGSWVNLDLKKNKKF